MEYKSLIVVFSFLLLLICVPCLWKPAAAAAQSIHSRYNPDSVSTVASSCSNNRGHPQQQFKNTFKTVIIWLIEGKAEYFSVIRIHQTQSQSSTIEERVLRGQYMWCCWVQFSFVISETVRRSCRSILKSPASCIMTWCRSTGRCLPL